MNETQSNTVSSLCKYRRLYNCAGVIPAYGLDSTLRCAQLTKRIYFTRYTEISIETKENKSRQNPKHTWTMISNRVETFHVSVSFGVLVWASFSHRVSAPNDSNNKGNISKCLEIALRLGKTHLFYHYLSPVRMTLKEITN